MEEYRTGSRGGQLPGAQQGQVRHDDPRLHAVYTLAQEHARAGTPAAYELREGAQRFLQLDAPLGIPSPIVWHFLDVMAPRGRVCSGEMKFTLWLPGCLRSMTGEGDSEENGLVDLLADLYRLVPVTIAWRTSTGSGAGNLVHSLALPTVWEDPT